MDDIAFAEYLRGQELADKTRAQRTYALKRIETAYDLDLDDEFAKNQLTDVMRSFAYSSADARAGLPNPSRMPIDADKLLTHLRWYRSHLYSYLRFRGGSIDSESETETVATVENELIEESVTKTFALERDLQSALRSNLNQLESGLKIEDNGSERRVEAGFIDILARDGSNTLTVIELKAETSKPDAIAQILSYMGCVAEEYNEPVRGILVAGDHHPRVILAKRALPNVLLKKYRYKFEFE